MFCTFEFRKRSESKTKEFKTLKSKEMKTNNKMATMTITVKDTAVIPYPEAELRDLNKLLEYDGMLVTIQENTGITPPTVRKIVADKRGQKAKVDDLIQFVKAFKLQFPQRA